MSFPCESYFFTNTHTFTFTHTHKHTHTHVLFPCTNTRREKYKVLARHEVSVPEVQLEELDSLGASWEQYLVVLEEGQSKLERHKDNFREKVCVV